MSKSQGISPHTCGAGDVNVRGKTMVIPPFRSSVQGMFPTVDSSLQWSKFCQWGECLGYFPGVHRRRLNQRDGTSFVTDSGRRFDWAEEQHSSCTVWPIALQQHWPTCFDLKICVCRRGRGGMGLNPSFFSMPSFRRVWRITFDPMLSRNWSRQLDQFSPDQQAMNRRMHCFYMELSMLAHFLLDQGEGEMGVLLFVLTAEFCLYKFVVMRFTRRR